MDEKIESLEESFKQKSEAEERLKNYHTAQLKYYRDRMMTVSNKVLEAYWHLQYIIHVDKYEKLEQKFEEEKKALANQITKLEKKKKKAEIKSAKKEERQEKLAEVKDKVSGKVSRAKSRLGVAKNSAIQRLKRTNIDLKIQSMLGKMAIKTLKTVYKISTTKSRLGNAKKEIINRYKENKRQRQKEKQEQRKKLEEQRLDQRAQIASLKEAIKSGSAVSNDSGLKPAPVK